MTPSQMQGEYPDSTGEGELSLGDLIQVAQDHLWLIVSIMATALACGYFAIRATPVLYKSEGVLLAEFKNEQLLTDIKGFESEDRLASFEAMNTLAASVVRSDVLLRVAGKVVDAPYVKLWSTNSLATNEIALILKRRCDASVRKQTRFIDVSVLDGSPVFAQKLAQLIMEEYLALEFARQQGTGKGATNFLSAEAEVLKQRLTDSEARLNAFVRTNTVSVRGGEEDLVAAELKSVNDRLLEAKAERMALDADWEQIKQISDDPEQLLAIPSVVQLPNVAEIRRHLLDKRAEIAELELRYKAKHPKMIEAKRVVESIVSALHTELRNAPNGVLLQLKKAQLAEEQLVQRVKLQEAQVAKVNELRLVYNRLKSEADHHRQLYDSVVKRRDEARITMSMTGREDAKHDVSIFETPNLPIVPAKPNKKLIIAASGVLGFAISFGLIYLLQMLDQTLKSVDQAEQVFGIPVLGAIPKSTEAVGKDDRLVITKSPDSHASEGFRTLRAAVGLLGREDERKVTMFTSAVPAEGKTFCSSNFAMAIAQSGKRTVIVDFDLRRPSVGKTFGIDMAQEGVSDCLLGKAKYDEVMVPTENAHLFVIPAGTLVPNPSELIASPHTQEFLDELKSAFDHVVVDNAPVTAVSDTLMIVGMVDTVCLVTKAAKTSIRVIGRAIELVRRAGVNPSGLVLNFINKSRGAGYKYYYYSDKKYAGGYAGGYGTQQRKQARS